MKKVLKLVLEKVRRWPESWALPLGLSGIYWSYYLLWLVFPLAAPYPPESLQKLVYAGFAMMLFNGLAWLGIKLNLFGMYDFYKNQFTKAFNSLTSCQKVFSVLSVYCFYLLCLIILVRTL